MKTIEYLNEYGFDGLKENLGIKVSQNEQYPNLYVLNYDQIESSKHKDHPVVRECRSLVLEYCDLNWRPVSRSFDRFFNYGEIDYDGDITKLTAYEKVDGSLVSVFIYNGQWLYRTKSMIMPAEDMCMPTGRSWKDLIESVIIGPFNHKDCTYIFEVVSRDNRVVTRYNDDYAYLLAIRNNETGEYIDESQYEVDYYELSKTSSKIRKPRKYEFDTLEHCLESAKEMPNLEEGYVMYDANNQPVLKIKSPAYVAAHRLRGEGALTTKRIMDLVFMNEQDEYLSIFPEDTDAIMPYVKAYGDMYQALEQEWFKVNKIENQKEYALQVKDLPIGAMLFRKRSKPEMCFNEIFEMLTANSKYNIVEQFKN